MSEPGLLEEGKVKDAELRTDQDTLSPSTETTMRHISNSWALQLTLVTLKLAKAVLTKAAEKPNSNLHFMYSCSERVFKYMYFVSNFFF